MCFAPRPSKALVKPNMAEDPWASWDEFIDVQAEIDGCKYV
jgi:hypothetical protein